ncbi:MAG: O-antigen ligase family protein [Bdellovibrio bacteriovorus]
MALPDRSRLAAGLLLLFAFSAWSLTGLANGALGLLTLLFLSDLPGHWSRLRRDPALWLLVVSLGLTTLLAARAAALLPETAPDQWDAIPSWILPLLFVVTAWWLRGDERLIRAVLATAAVGLVVGVLRKSDWSLLGEILGGLRYHFGYAALGLGFLVSMMLTGLVVFRRRILGLRVGARPRPVLGWTLWLLGIAFTLAVLVVTQSRGSALSLGMVAVGFALVYRLRPIRGSGHGGPGRAAVLSGLLMVLVLMSLVLWSSRERIYYDLRSLTATSGDEFFTQGIGYDSSSAIRLNLYRLGLELFAARPLLGWGPGSRPTEYLVPNRVIPLSDLHVNKASQASHLHSVPIEILVRFGLAGLTLALLFLALMIRAYRWMWACSADRELRLFLVAGGLLTLLFVLFDFRLIHLDLRFFFILFFGILYSYRFADLGSVVPPRGEPAA